MKSDILITVDSKTSNVHLNNGILGVSQENIQSNLVFNFLNGFVDGNACLEVKFYYIHHYEYILTGNETGEYEIDGYIFNMPNNIENGDKLYFYDILKQLYILKNNNYELISISKGTTQNKLNLIPKSSGFFPMEKQNEQYILPIKNSLLLQKGQIDLQLKVIQTGTNVPVFKSNIFYLNIKDAINATDILMDEYIDFINLATEKIVEINNAISEVDTLDIDVNKSGTTTTVEFTKKDGTTKSVEILDGERGPQGEQGDKGDNATINGVNTLNIVAGTNINLSQSGSTLTINNTYSYDDSNIKQDISTNASNISQNTTDIATLNNNLINYSLITETGSKLAITIDNSTYQMYITLKDKNDNVIHTSNTIDLPIEQLVMNVTYDNTNKAIVITLQNGTVTSVPVGALIDGLVSNDDLNTTLADYVQFNNFASKNNTGVIKAANGLDINSSNGNTYAEVKTYSQYSSLNNEYLISKGTLENVITGKDLTTKSYVDGLVGDIATALDTIQGEVI